MNDDDSLLVSNDGFVRTMTLNHPERLNALTAKIGRNLLDELASATDDDTVRVVVLTGAGRAFCSGIDITPGTEALMSANPTQQELIDDLGWIGHSFLAMRRECDKPIIAAINGPAVGAGLALAMACDVRIATRSALLAPGYLGIGAPPDGGLSITLIEAIGRERAFRLLVDSRTLTADEAGVLGLLSEVVDDSDFAERVTAYARSLAARPPLALRLTKRSLNRAVEDSTESTLRGEIAGVILAFSTDDARTARKARRSGTVGNYVGR